MKIRLSRAVTRTLIKELKAAGRKEIGGVLFAENTGENEFTVIQVSIDRFSGSPAHFHRSPENHKVATDAFFAQTGYDYARFNYLGEWHSHPSFPAAPSAGDVREMRSLVNDIETNISFAVLIIVKLKWYFWIEASATLFSRAQEPQSVVLDCL